MRFLLIILALFVSPAFADGHWEMVGTPKTDGGTGYDHSANGGGLFATATVNANGSQVTASGNGVGHIWNKMQACTSKGGKYFEAYTWVGTGTGYVEVDGSVDIGATGDAAYGGAGRVYGYTQMKSSLTAELLCSANLSVSTGGAGKLGSVSVKGPNGSIELSGVAPGSLDHDHQSYDPPSDSTSGSACALYFWHQRRTYGYVEMLLSGGMVNNGTATINMNGTVSSSPALGGPCDGGGQQQEVPCTCTTCMQVSTTVNTVTCWIMTTLFF